MKISIAWVFDHIEADWNEVDIPRLVDRFNRTTAEIEHVQRVITNAQQFTFAVIKAVSVDTVEVEAPEWNDTFTLPRRDDALDGHCYLIKRDGNMIVWATVADFHCEKDNLLPEFACSPEQLNGVWRGSFEVEDYILDVDNKSITNRPDMWGHRGFAREIAAILKKPLKPIEQFLLEKKIVSCADAVVSECGPIIIENKDPEGCKRFAGLYCDHVAYTSSLLWMAHRLCRVNSKPINAMVDMTNYVMLDLSQPMHAFDAKKISTEKIVPRRAKKGETLTLLDEQVIELTPEDLVISDGKDPLALAGVKGGLGSGITAKTKQVFLESANFDATTVRRASERHKIRTESSARFEKSLDPNQNILGIKRLLKLLQQEGIAYETADAIVSCGPLTEPKEIRVTHKFLESRLGVTFDTKTVTSILERLGFSVTVERDGAYKIIVPTFRSTKDVTIPEDIVEEVGRFYGYENIVPVLPARKVEPTDLHAVTRKRLTKHFFSYVMQSHELQSYGFFDESFLREINWKPNNVLSVKNPGSENHARLVTTLLPYSLQAIKDNCPDNDLLRFYEWGRVWYKKGDTVVEQRELAGIFYDKKNKVDFYASKELIKRYFDVIELSCSWKQVAKPEHPWFMPYQTAHIMHDNKVIGIAGKVHPLFIDKLCGGDAFLFALNADYLLAYKTPTNLYVAPTKYPSVARDISVLLSHEHVVADLFDRIRAIDPLITNVTLVDFFTKEEWGNKRSLTFRFVLQSTDKTLTKEEVDTVWSAVAKIFEKLGAEVR